MLAASSESLSTALQVAAATGTGVVSVTAGYLYSRRQEAKDEQQVKSLEQSLALQVRAAADAAALAFERLDDTGGYPEHRYALEQTAIPINGMLRSRAATSYKILTDHYANALTQSRAYFLLSYIVGIIGFLVMLGGVAIAYNGSLDSGVLAAVVGAAVDAAAGLVFVQANKAQTNSQENLKHLGETVKDDANRETALHLVSLIHDGERRDELLGDLSRLAMESATFRPSGRSTVDAENTALPQGKSSGQSSNEEPRPRPSVDQREADDRR